MTSEIRKEIAATPLLPLVRMLATVFMIFAVSTAYFVSGAFITQYCRATGIPDLGPAGWMSIGLALGLFVLLFALLDSDIKRYALYGVLVALVLYLVVAPLSYTAYGAEYGARVLIGNLGVMVGLAAALALMAPPTLGMFGIWRNGRLSTFTAVFLCFLMTAFQPEGRDGLASGVLLGATVLMWLVPANAAFDFMDATVQVRYRQMSITVETRRCLLSSITQTLIYMVPFLLIYGLFLGYSGIVAALSPPAVSESLEINSIYVYGVALLSLSAVLWLVGTARQVQGRKVARDAKAFARKVREVGRRAGKEGPRKDKTGRSLGGEAAAGDIAPEREA